VRGFVYYRLASAVEFFRQRRDIHALLTPLSPVMDESMNGGI